MERRKIIIGLFMMALLVATMAGALAAITGDITTPTNGQKFNNRTDINFSLVPEETDNSFNITNVTLYTDFGGTWAANSTQDAGVNTTSLSWLLNATSDGNFSFNFLIYNNNSGSAWASASFNYSMTIDTANPTFSGLTPADGNATSAEGDSIVFSFTPTTAYEISNCTLYIDSGRFETITSVTNASSNSFSAWTSTAGDHGWYTSCTDDHSNTGNSTTRTIGIRALGTGSGSSSGGSTPEVQVQEPSQDGQALAIAGGDSGEGSFNWAVVWWALGILAGIAVLFYFGGIIWEVLGPVLMFLVSNIIGWVILAVIALIILIVWWVV